MGEKPDSCNLYYYCGGQSVLCRGSRFSCWGGCPSKDILESIAALEESSFHSEGRWTAEQIGVVLKEGTSTLSLVHADERIVGYSLFRCIPPEGELLRLAIDARYRRKGFGRLLLQDGLQMLAERNIQEVFLEVAATSDSAIAFYLDQNFEEVGRRKLYYPHLNADGIVMRKVLLTAKSEGVLKERDV